ncbi:MAG: helicase HerA domain-containing protein [Candidatus Odinarchaeota archaeon]
MVNDPEFFLGLQRDGEETPFNVPSTFFLTHAVVLGASGSGKTVMCKSIVEEAVRSNIPVIAFDPKGDIGALGIALGGDFRKENIMVHAEVEGQDLGKNPEEIAESWIDLYRTKLNQSFGEEFAKAEDEYSKKVAVILITPKNSAGVQISLTPDFTKPANYDEMMDESPDAVLSALDLKIQLLLSRCGIQGASSTDNRVIFLNHLIRYFWEEEEQASVSLGDLIGSLEDPPFKNVGNLSVEKFISKGKRGELARLINALLVRAVPGVEMNFDKLVQLARKEGKTPIIIFDLRKIQDEDERTTFVAEVLGEIQRWVWSKGGTSRLRAVMYFDELYGFMPAGSRTPPSKTALLILIKQARAAGLGCVLATQNPGDLDYRGLSNISSWFLGRLTTPQDIAKVESALKAVFEATGGSQQEFKQLMSSMRALKPGEFIAYNPRLGVLPIRTRWLLSLHKGPLTDKEIRHLSLRPPKKKRKTKVKTEPEIKEVVREEEKTVAKEELPIDLLKIPEIKLVNNKPKVKKLVDRFLKTRIDMKESSLRMLINERLNLLGNEDEDGFLLTIDDVKPFYSPLHYFRILIEIKRRIEIGDGTIPIEISQRMTRAFDLSKVINWDSAAVEGIHPSSIPPKDLALDPLASEYQFYDFPKDTIEKISKNIVWYFSNSPFPEAGRIYYSQIRDYERKEMEKLAGSKPKAISRLSNQISNLEERYEELEEKKEQYLLRLEQLAADKKGLIAEGRATRAVERSIESARNQIEKIETRMEEFKQRIQKAEKQRKEAMQEKESAYDQLIKQMDILKKQTLPPDLYKPGKADIKIEEEAIYWIPRVLIHVLTEKNTGNIESSLRSSFFLNLNLYNGNGEITCGGCGQEMTTQNYYQKLLETEISPPAFVCTVCLNPFCSEHLDFCVECGKGACIDHIGECEICKISVCQQCSSTCVYCGKTICQQHTWVCSTCGKVLCTEEPFNTCEVEENRLCRECSMTNLFTCSTCGKNLCEEHSAVCESCGKRFCEIHLKTCRKCGRQVCSSCGRVKAKLKGEEVIVRCAECS